MSHRIKKEPAHGTQKWDDLDIQALVDGSVKAAEQKRLRKIVESNPQARERYEYLEDQKRLLRAWWKTFS